MLFFTALAKSPLTTSTTLLFVTRFQLRNVVVIVVVVAAVITVHMVSAIVDWAIHLNDVRLASAEQVLDVHSVTYAKQ